MTLMDKKWRFGLKIIIVAWLNVFLTLSLLCLSDVNSIRGRLARLIN